MINFGFHPLLGLAIVCGDWACQASYSLGVWRPITVWEYPRQHFVAELRTESGL